MTLFRLYLFSMALIVTSLGALVASGFFDRHPGDRYTGAIDARHYPVSVWILPK